MEDYQANRAERRRTEREMRTSEGLKLSDDVEVILKYPQHWHVSLIVYYDERGDGVLTHAIHFHDLVCNDITLAVSLAFKAARPLAGPRRTNYRLETVAQCSVEEHLLSVPDVNRYMGHAETADTGEAMTAEYQPERAR